MLWLHTSQLVATSGIPGNAVVLVADAAEAHGDGRGQRGQTPGQRVKPTPLALL